MQCTSHRSGPDAFDADAVQETLQGFRSRARDWGLGSGLEFGWGVLRSAKLTSSVEPHKGPRKTTAL